MTAAEILIEKIKAYDTYGIPLDTYYEALKETDIMIQGMMDVLGRAINEEDTVEWEFEFGHYIAMIVLGGYGYTKAEPLVTELMTLKKDDNNEFLPEFAYNQLPKLWPIFYGDDLAKYRKIIENEDLELIIRESAVSGLAVAVINNIISRDLVVVYFRELITDRFADGNDMLSTVIDCISGIYPEPLMEEIEELYIRDLIDTNFIELESIKNRLVYSLEEHMEIFQSNPYYSFQGIIEEIGEIIYIKCYNEIELPEEDLDELYDSINSDFDFNIRKHFEYPDNVPVRIESKPGRNEPCPCGSGKKYKKCCGKG